MSNQKYIIPYKRFIGSMIPNWLMRRKEISQGAKLSYGRLCQYAGRENYAFPFQKTLADELAVSVTQVQNYLHELESYGLIERQRMGLNKPNRYRFLNSKWISDERNIVNSETKNTEHQETQEVCKPDTQHTEGHETNYPVNPILRESILRESQRESASSSHLRPRHCSWCSEHIHNESRVCVVLKAMHDEFHRLHGTCLDFTLKDYRPLVNSIIKAGFTDAEIMEEFKHFLKSDEDSYQMRPECLVLFAANISLCRRNQNSSLPIYPARLGWIPLCATQKQRTAHLIR